MDKVDMMICEIPSEEKKRFKALCVLQDKTYPQMLTHLMDKFEAKE